MPARPPAAAAPTRTGPPVADSTTCPRCQAPGVELVAGRLALHVKAGSPRSRCDGSKLLLADLL
jgi:hypothetical protein